MRKYENLEVSSLIIMLKGMKELTIAIRGQNEENKRLAEKVLPKSRTKLLNDYLKKIERKWMIESWEIQKLKNATELEELNLIWQDINSWSSFRLDNTWRSRLFWGLFVLVISLFLFSAQYYNWKKKFQNWFDGDFISIEEYWKDEN